MSRRNGTGGLVLDNANGVLVDVGQYMQQRRADYDAAKTSRFRRVRKIPSAGADADYHYANETDYLRIIENARDMARNDVVVGPLVERAVMNTIQSGFAVDPQTGDAGVDAELSARWVEWSNDPDAVDLAGELSFTDVEQHAFRSMIVDGDIIALPTTSGHLELIEAHRCRSPKTKRNVVHGVLLDSNRKRVEYWLTVGEARTTSTVRVKDMRRIPVRDQAGRRQVFHVYNPRRVSQTRGVSALAAAFDELGIFQDVQFAKLVQQQIVSCFAILAEREASETAYGGLPRTGEQSTETLPDGTTRTLQGIAPGMFISGAAGERLTGFSPNVPNPEFFEHVRLILMLVGTHLGLPLVLVTLDASETNFSGWRGAVDQARLGFRQNQAALIRRLHRPAWAWKVNEWIADDTGLRRAATTSDVAIYRHTWHAPRWPYIEPLKDAAADLLRVRTGLTSWRRIQAERGGDENDIAREVVEDNARRIRLAIEAATEINGEYPDAGVTWRDINPLPLGDRVSLAISADAGDPAVSTEGPTDE
jgi:lambda family phage portal protein